MNFQFVAGQGMQEQRTRAATEQVDAPLAKRPRTGPGQQKAGSALLDETVHLVQQVWQAQAEQEMRFPPEPKLDFEIAPERRRGPIC